MSRKARAGHVTGGRVFGYDNVDVWAGSQRSHVERRINETEAAIIRRIFALSIDGHGGKAIAKMLNADGTASPRAQRGRSQTWAPSSVREVLYRDLYPGFIALNRTRKRNQWGQQQQAARPPADWIDVEAPHLAIVSSETWTAAHARIAAARAMYRTNVNGRPFGRPARGNPSKYLLTNLLQCGCCGGGSSLGCWRRSGRVRIGRDRGRTCSARRAEAP
jgi:site-specific DNA recombinase